MEASIGREICPLRSVQEGAAERDRRLEQANETAEALSSEEARATTAELDESLTTLERSLRTLQATGAGGGEEVSAALEQIDAAQGALDEVREAQEAGIAQSTGLTELQESLDSLQGALSALPDDASPQVLANPFRLVTENLATPPNAVGFYAPGVLAILIQHIAVSLASLAVIRERLSGAYEFFEVSPLGPGELLAGKFATYFGLVLGVNLAVAAVLAYFLGIPVEGGFSRMALAMALLTVAALGAGFMISALVRSQLQAVQVSMLLLIASGFFSGFLFPLAEMRGPATAVSYFLPATYGLRALQDVMIRGQAISGFDLLGLLVMAAVTLGLARYLMGRKKA